MKSICWSELSLNCLGGAAVALLLTILTVSCGRQELVGKSDFRDITIDVFERVAVVKYGGDCEENRVRFLPYSKCYWSEYDASDMPGLDKIKANFQSFRISELKAEKLDVSGDPVRFSYTCVDLKVEEGYEFWSASIPIEEGTPDCLNSFDGMIQYWFVRPLDSDVVYYIQATQ